MNKRTIIKQLVRRMKGDFITSITTEQANAMLTHLAEIMAEALIKGERIMLRDFLILYPTTRAPRKGYHFRERKAVEMPAKKTIKVKASKQLLKRLS